MKEWRDSLAIHFKGHVCAHREKLLIRVTKDATALLQSAIPTIIGFKLMNSSPFLGQIASK